MIGSAVLLAVELVVLALVVARHRARMRRAYDRLATLRWEPIAAGPAHEPLRPLVTELEAAGYVVDSYIDVGIGGRTSPGAALVHPDGSMATVGIVRCGPIAVRRAKVESVLVPGERWLASMGFAAVAVARGALVEVVSRRPNVPRLVTRHRAARAWLGLKGIDVVPVALGEAGAVVESQWRSLARRRPMPIFSLVWRALVGGGGLRAPLSSRTDLGRTLAKVRRAQAEAGIAG